MCFISSIEINLLLTLPKLLSYNKSMKEIILASQSPRRKDLLEKCGYNFKIIPSKKEEVADKNLQPQTYAKLLAKQKAEDIASTNKDSIVIGADTVVHIDGMIIGKPKDDEDAKNTLRYLSGKYHFVSTGYALISKEQSVFGVETTKVLFNELSDELINEYVSRGLAKGKAGSYGIQDGYPLVNEYDGDYENVVGLPIKKIKEILENVFKI